MSITTESMISKGTHESTCPHWSSSKDRDLTAVLYTLSHICGSNHFPIYRAPTPLTKDCQGSTLFPILPSLSFTCFFLSSLRLSPFVTSAGFRDCWYLGCTHWSIPISHLCLLPLFFLPALYSCFCHTFVSSGGQSWRTGLVIRSR